MSSLAKAVSFDSSNMWVDFVDGRKLGVPLAYFPRLLNAQDNFAGGSPAASHFFCFAKKSNPKKATHSRASLTASFG